MKMTIDRHQFVREFEAYNRGNEFSAWALNRLFEYFEEYEAGSGEEIELDVIAICCEFSESYFDDFRKDYPQFADIEDVDVLIERVNEETSVVAWDDERILYVSF